MMKKQIPLSVLDLVPICEGFTISKSIDNSTKLAQEVEKLGYERYWIAEHHNFSSIASAATSVILAQIGASAYNGEFEQCFEKYLNTFCKNIF